MVKRTPKNLRTYGDPPYTVAVIHGGPGAAGEMAPVARNLASTRGVLEPLQTAGSLEGQIDELRTVLDDYGDIPVILIGFSWGAWLAYLFVASYPVLVKKLILIGSGGFEEKYASNTFETRLNRLDTAERKEFISLTGVLDSYADTMPPETFARLGAMLAKADAYEPENGVSDAIDYRPDIFRNVWKSASVLRRSGQFLEMGRLINCPVVAIHGDYDPHPADGVRIPLSSVLKHFRFILLEKCGHKPWGERQARDTFFRILSEELS